MRTVRRGLWAASIAVLAAGSAVGAEPKKDQPKAPVAAPTKELLDRLLKAYRLYELPEPPADAPLVSFLAPAWSGGGNFTPWASG